VPSRGTSAPGLPSPSGSLALLDTVLDQPDLAAWRTQLGRLVGRKGLDALECGDTTLLEAFDPATDQITERTGGGALLSACRLLTARLETSHPAAQLRVEFVGGRPARAILTFTPQGDLTLGDQLTGRYGSGEARQVKFATLLESSTRTIQVFTSGQGHLLLESDPAAPLRLIWQATPLVTSLPRASATVPGKPSSI